jgi:hypothetical protein
MRLLRLSDVETAPADRVFRYSRWHALLVVFAALVLAGWLLWRAYSIPWKPGYYIAAVILLFVDLLRRFVTARFRPSNWLVRMTDSGLFIQFRSYLNYHLPPNDLTVVFLSFGEIRSARLIKERVTVPDPQGHGNETQYLRYVELELAGDLAQLASALAEASEIAPAEKRWYGTSSTLYQDHPVRMQSPPFLRLHWQVVPGPRKFLDALRPYAGIADTVSLSEDFAHLGSLSREEQERRLRELVARGQTIAAVYMARKLYGGSLADAKNMIDGLSGAATRTKPATEP